MSLTISIILSIQRLFNFANFLFKDSTSIGIFVKVVLIDPGEVSIDSFLYSTFSSLSDCLLSLND